MAHLVRPWIVRWADPVTGKRATKDTPGAVAKKERARKWYGVGSPGYGRKRVPLAENKDAAQREHDNFVRLTLDRYAHTDRGQLAGAVARLPGIGRSNPTGTGNREQLAGLAVAAG